VEGVARELTGVVVDAGLKVHRALGPGLLESADERCLAHELSLRGGRFQTQVHLPVIRLDLVVEGVVILEIKAVEALTRLHEAQLLTYLRLSGLSVGLLMNFNAMIFKGGLRRLVN
jgi:GxxExxY protein